jgi:hypothetical protein
LAKRSLVAQRLEGRLLALVGHDFPQEDPPRFRRSPRRASRGPCSGALQIRDLPLIDAKFLAQFFIGRFRPNDSLMRSAMLFIFEKLDRGVARQRIVLLCSCKADLIACLIHQTA